MNAISDNTFYEKNQVRSAQIADDAIERKRRSWDAASGRIPKNSMFDGTSGGRDESSSSAFNGLFGGVPSIGRIGGAGDKVSVGSVSSSSPYLFDMKAGTFGGVSPEDCKRMMIML